VEAAEQKGRNRAMHAKEGNKAGRDYVKLTYWNKGPSNMKNKQLDIEQVIKKAEPDILGLGEANGVVGCDEQRQDGYELHLGIEAHGGRGARVAVFTKKTLIVERRHDLEGGGANTVWLQVHKKNKESILVMCGYREWRVPGQGEQSGSLEEQIKRWKVVLGQWEKALDEGKETINMMDANLDALTWTKENLPASHSSVRLRPLTKALFEKIIPRGVVQMVQTVTRAERGTSGACLDHIYTNRPDRMGKVEAEYTGMSDHKMVSVRRYGADLKQGQRMRRKRMFKNFDKLKFKDAVEKMPEIKECMEAKDADSAAERLTNGLCRVLDEMAPVKTVQIRRNYVKYRSEKTENLQREAKEAQQAAAASGNDEDWRAFKALRNQKNRSVVMDKVKWQEAKLRRESGSKDMWQTAKEILGWRGAGPPTQLEHKGEVVNSPSGLANAMNEFFVEKVKKLRSSIKGTDKDPAEKLREAMKGRKCSFDFEKVSSKKVEEQIAALGCSGATGTDYIDVTSIKEVKKAIAPCIAHIINTSIVTAVFPKCYKHAKVVPLLKASDKKKTDCKSYRPISLLPVLSKVMEKVLFEQLSRYLEENNLLHKNHHGGRKGHSTMTAMLQMQDIWLEAAERGEMTAMMMTDLSAAYDLWDHRIGIDKAMILGVNKKAADWLESYVSGRRQSCLVDGHLSRGLELQDHSVPQGSVGAPILFLMANIDLPDVIHKEVTKRGGGEQERGEREGRGEDGGDGGEGERGGGEQEGHAQEGQREADEEGGGDAERAKMKHKEEGTSIHYVDDGTVMFSSRRHEEMSDQLSKKYEAVAEYMAANKMVLNDDKTKLVVMGTRRMAAERSKVKVQAGDYVIEPEETGKLLGITVMQSMAWNKHILEGKESVVAQVRQRVNGLKKMSHRADFETKLKIANGIVMGKIAYGIAVWGNGPEYLMKAVQVQQLDAARVVCGYRSYYWSTGKLLKQCGWSSIKQMYWRQVLQVAHIAKKTGKPEGLYEAMKVKHNYETRAAMNISRSNPARSSFNCAATKYSKLPEDLKRMSDMNVFKRRLKRWVSANIPIR
jgi:hypothetical protein